MQHVMSQEMGDFARIYDEDVELVSVTRGGAQAITEASARLIETRQTLRQRWVQEVRDTQAAYQALPDSIDTTARATIADEVSLASEDLAELIGCEQVGVRLETLNAPMCPRFHVDQVQCRLLATLVGPATEWIANDEVDWTAFADLGNIAPPLRADTHIRQLQAGHWSLLKGGSWHDDFNGVVHRSPHSAGERVLLSLDPIV